MSAIRRSYLACDNRLNMHLAQVNIGRIVAPMDSPAMAEFKANLDPINSLAESSPGFVWRLQPFPEPREELAHA
jgi:hypothetical protein